MRSSPTRRIAARKTRQLYKSAKISDARFVRVVEHFASDHSATQTASNTGLSVNSVHALFRKLRIFFFEVGLFMDYYAGTDPLEFVSDNPVFERALLEFHFHRVAARHGLKSPGSEPPYHFAESCWRYDFKVMADERPDGDVVSMMTGNLLEIIRLCGPVGARPRNRLKGLRVVARQADQRAVWLQRNALGFSTPSLRAGLRDVLSIPLADLDDHPSG